MKYLIEDTDEHTLGEIENFFIQELQLTDLKKENIIVEEGLKSKIAVMELSRIFDENNMGTLYEIDIEGFHLRKTGHFIEFSKEEIQSRFEDVYGRTLTYLINKL